MDIVVVLVVVVVVVVVVAVVVDVVVVVVVRPIGDEMVDDEDLNSNHEKNFLM